MNYQEYISGSEPESLSPGEARFDPTRGFTMFGHWMRTFEMLPEDQDRVALVRAIAARSMFNEEPTFENVSDYGRFVLPAVWAGIDDGIKQSVGNRKKWHDTSGDAPTDKQKAILSIWEGNPELPYSEIARRAKSSRQYVTDVINKAKANREGEPTANTATSAYKTGKQLQPVDVFYDEEELPF